MSTEDSQNPQLLPEHDPTKWFIGNKVKGPVIVTGVSGGPWLLSKVNQLGGMDSWIVSFKEFTGSRFFVPANTILHLEQESKECFASGYRLD